MSKNKQILIVISLGVIAFIYIMLAYNLSVKSQLEEFEYKISKLEFAFDDVSKQLEEVVNLNKIIQASDYSVKKILKDNLTLADVSLELTSNKLSSYEDVMLIYRKIYDSSKEDNYDYSYEEWESIEVFNDMGIYCVDFLVSFSCDYEMKITYKDDNHIRYEQLPDLDLYKKAEYAFMKSINIYKLKNKKLEFDVQIAKFRSIYDIKLLSAKCNIHYNNEILYTYDILGENEVKGRKEPRGQLEHMDGEYWFLIKEIVFDKINDFDESKVLIEIIIEDSINNIYKMTSGIN